MLKTILAISGKPGLFRFLGQGGGNLYVESLLDKKRMPVHAKDRVISLGDITMYTTEDDIPLSEVLTCVYKEFEGQEIDKVAFATSEALFEAFSRCVPNFDRERVYPSDVKKLFSWYNLLIRAGFTDFTREEREEGKSE